MNANGPSRSDTTTSPSRNASAEAQGRRPFAQNALVTAGADERPTLREPRDAHAVERTPSSTASRQRRSCVSSPYSQDSGRLAGPAAAAPWRFRSRSLLSQVRQRRPSGSWRLPRVPERPGYCPLLQLKIGKCLRSLRRGFGDELICGSPTHNPMQLIAHCHGPSKPRYRPRKP